MQRSMDSKTIEIGSHMDKDSRCLPKSLTALLSGATAGLIAKTIVAPLDRVTNEKYSLKSLPRIFNHIIREEGFLALWRGNSATVLRIAPYAGIQFMTYDYLKRWFSRYHRGVRRPSAGGASTKPSTESNCNTHMQSSEIPRSWSLKVIELMLCGGVAGAVSSTVTYPLDLARSRLAVTLDLHPEMRQDSNTTLRVYRLLRQWYQAGGVRELYRGLSPTIMGIIPYGAISFSTNEVMKQMVSDVTGKSPDTIQSLMCGAVAGAVSQSFVYPFEMLRRRMQTTGHVDREAYLTHMSQKLDSTLAAHTKGARAHIHKEKTMMDTFRELLRTHGWRVFFKGLSLNWLKGPIAVSISFTIYDTVKKSLMTYEIADDD